MANASPPPSTTAWWLPLTTAQLWTVVRNVFALSVLVLWFLVFSAGVLIPSDVFRANLDLVGTGVDFKTTVWNLLPAMLLYTPLNAAIVACLAGYLGGHMSHAQYKNVIPGRNATSGQLREFSFLTEPPHISSLRGLIGYLVMLSGVLVVSSTTFATAGFLGSADGIPGTPPGQTSPQPNAAAGSAPAPATAADAGAGANTATTATTTAPPPTSPSAAPGSVAALSPKSIIQSSQYARFGCLVTLLAFSLGYNPTIFERMVSQVSTRGQLGPVGALLDADSDRQGERKSTDTPNASGGGASSSSSQPASVNASIPPVAPSR